MQSMAGSVAMVIEYIRYKIADSKQEQFLSDYRLASESLMRSPHCLAYELTRCGEEPDRFVLRLEWDSYEGHLQGFRNSPEFLDFFSHVRLYLTDVEEMHHYEMTDVVGSKEGASASAGE